MIIHPIVEYHSFNGMHLDSNGIHMLCLNQHKNTNSSSAHFIQLSCKASLENGLSQSRSSVKASLA